MWWLDDNFYRGNSGNRRRILYRSMVPTPSNQVPGRRDTTVRPPRKLQLTEAQIAANQSLLEGDETQQSEVKLLRADIVALEQAVRDQKAQRDQIEARLVETVGSHAQQIHDVNESAQQSIEQLEKQNSELQANQQRLESQRRQEAVDLTERLATAQQLADQRADELDGCEGELSLLRQSLASAEQKLRDRDSELRAQQSQSEAQQQEYAQNLAEAQYQHSVESEHLQAIAASAQHRADERKQLVEHLRQQFKEQNESHQIASQEIAQTYQNRIDQTTAELFAAQAKITDLAAEIEQLGNNTVSLSDEHGQLRRQWALAIECAEVSTATVMKLSGVHAVELERLQLENTQFHTALDQSVVEKELVRTRADIAHAEFERAIQDLNGKLDAAEKRAVVSETTALDIERRRAESSQSVAQWKQELAELKAAREKEHQAFHQEIAVLNEIRKNENQKLKQEIAELSESRENEHQDFKLEIAALRETRENEHQGFRTEIESARTALENEQRESSHRITSLQAASKAEQRKLREEIEGLRKSLERRQDEVITQSKQSKSTEWQLRAECDGLKQQIQELTSNSARTQADHNREIADLNQTLQQRESELEALWAQCESANKELDRKQGALERLQSKNERLLELHDEQFTTMQTRIDEMVLALDSERRKREASEKEARRLSINRSERIAFLGKQRHEFSSQVGELQSEIERLKSEDQKLRSSVCSAEQALQTANAQLAAKTKEVKRLSLESCKQNELRTRSAPHEDKQITDARDEIFRLASQVKRAENKLRVQQQELDARQAPDREVDIEFAITQRDRTIALLEQEAVVLQERLQREAAARRKAEGAMKRGAKSGELHAGTQAAWSEIEAADQITRLKRTINALHNINLLERQRALAEIARYKKEIERLKSKSANRAA